MAVAPASRLGPYVIVKPLGRGGMGRVYLAKDTRLGRTVAIKVLPPEFAASREMRSRLEREAKLASALNDPHICTIDDIGSQGDVVYLVMEYVEGETLAARLSRGAMNLEEAVRHSREIALALGKAHRVGIVHRDVKPGNVMLTKTGVKLLDFGLAKWFEATPPDADSDSPTRSVHGSVTEDGRILGTLHYVSPEQLEGNQIDGRADVWAIGAVLYEMLTGKQAFSGNTRSKVIAAILGRDPPSATEDNPQVPSLLDSIIRRCLAKDPNERWQSADDVAGVLELVRHPTIQASGPKRSRVVIVGLAIALGLAVAGLFLTYSKSGSGEERLVLSISPPTGSQTAFTAGVAFSPDGKDLAFEAIQDGKSLLWIYSLRTGQYRVLSGTEGAAYPFWSPDGRLIGFFSRGQMKIIPAFGGPTQTILRVGITQPSSGSWGMDGTIYFHGQRRAVIQAVSSSGGEPWDVTKLEPQRTEARHWNAQLLSDGDHLLYAVRGRFPGVFVASLSNGNGKLLLPASSAIEAGGKLIYSTREGALSAQRLNWVPQMRWVGFAYGPSSESEVKLVGETNSLTQERASVPSISTAFPSTYLASASSTDLVFKPYDERRSPVSLVWISREGKELSTLVQLANCHGLRLSPDGDQVAFSGSLSQGTASYVWVIDAAGGGPRRLGEGDAVPVWSPDGGKIAHRKLINGRFRAVIRSIADGSEEVLLDETSLSDVPWDWSPNGETLSVHRYLLGTTNSQDIWSVKLPSGKATPLVEGEADASQAVFSPDGQWVAYQSDEADQPDVYLRRTDGQLNARRLSANGGIFPLWRRDGKELFYVAPGGKVMSVRLRLGEVVEAERPQHLFTVDSQWLLDDRFTFFNSPIDVSADGERFLVSVTRRGLTPLTLIRNWQSTPISDVP